MKSTATAIWEGGLKDGKGKLSGDTGTSKDAPYTFAKRFEGTGGPYLYTRAAFGRFVAFEVGWMQWFTRASSQASIMAGIAVALGYYWPTVTAGWPRHRASPAGPAPVPGRHGGRSPGTGRRGCRR